MRRIKKIILGKKKKPSTCCLKLLRYIHQRHFNLIRNTTPPSLSSYVLSLHFASIFLSPCVSCFSPKTPPPFPNCFVFSLISFGENTQKNNVVAGVHRRWSIGFLRRSRPIHHEQPQRRCNRRQQPPPPVSPSLPNPATTPRTLSRSFFSDRTTPNTNTNTNTNTNNSNANPHR